MKYAANIVPNNNNSINTMVYWFCALQQPWKCKVFRHTALIWSRFSPWQACLWRFRPKLLI